MPIRTVDSSHDGASKSVPHIVACFPDLTRRDTHLIVHILEDPLPWPTFPTRSFTLSALALVLARPTTTHLSSPHDTDSTDLSLKTDPWVFDPEWGGHRMRDDGKVVQTFFHEESDDPVRSAEPRVSSVSPSVSLSRIKRGRDGKSMGTYKTNSPR